MIKLPVRQHGARAEGGSDAVGKMTAVRLLHRIEERVHGLGRADVAGGNGRLHAHDWVLVVGRLAQAGGTILEVRMPVTQLMGGSSSSLRFFTFQKL